MLRGRGSNPDLQVQNLTCYHYTIPHYLPRYFITLSIQPSMRRLLHRGGRSIEYLFLKGNFAIEQDLAYIFRHFVHFLIRIYRIVIYVVFVKERRSEEHTSELQSQS